MPYVFQMEKEAAFDEQALMAEITGGRPPT